MKEKTSCNYMRDLFFHTPVKSYIKKLTFQHLKTFFYNMDMKEKNLLQLYERCDFSFFS